MQDWSGEGTRPVIFREDAEVSGVINGSAAVMAGATLQLTGMVTGDLAVEIGGNAIVHGTVRGAIRNRAAMSISLARPTPWSTPPPSRSPSSTRAPL